MNPITCQKCHSVLETEKRPKDTMRAILPVLLPIIIHFFLYNYSSWLPCFSQSIKLSLTATVGHFISKKVFLILLSDFILLFLAIDFNLCGSSSDLMNNFYDEYLMRLGNYLLSPSDAILTEPHIAEEKIAVEEGFKNNIYDYLFVSMQDGQPPFYEKHGGDLSRRVQTLDDNQLRQGWLALEEQPWQSYFVEVEDVDDEKDLDVVVVKEVIVEEINPVRTKDEFEALTIDELDHRFKEFIKKQKQESKRRWESLQFVMV